MGKKMMALWDGPGAPPQLLHLDKPDFARGDAEYFDPASTARYQIRPLCLSDMCAGFTYRPGCWHLVVRTNIGLKLRSSLHLPVPLRKNTLANAKEAYERLIRKQPNFERLVRAFDSAQKPAA